MHALATPLMTKADGTKFGKTEGGALWLDPELTSPYAFFQFWLNTDDRDVVDLPARCSRFRAREEIEALEKAVARAAAGPRGAARAGRGAHRAGARRRRSATRWSAASQALFGRGELAGPRPARPWPPRWPSCRRPRSTSRPTAGRRSSTCWPPPGWRPAGARPGGRSRRAAPTSTTPGSTDEDAVVGGRTTCCAGEWLVLRRGKRTLAAVRVERRLTPGGRPVSARNALTCGFVFPGAATVVMFSTSPGRERRTPDRWPVPRVAPSVTHRRGPRSRR